MAISRPHYQLLKQLHAAGELPQAGSILEIGEANIYSDLAFEDIAADIERIENELLRNRIKAAFDSQVAGSSPLSTFAIAKLIYRMFFDAREIVSIDWNGTESALRLDLNQPINLGRQFETVFNHGTAEHIFSIANVFKVMHDHCAVGGLMVHESPFTGWIDHGFYCLQPTLFWDLAAVNEYDVVEMDVEEIESGLIQLVNNRDQIHLYAKIGDIPANAMLWTVFRKKVEAPFCVPMQGYYSRSISADASKAWMELR